VKETHTEGIKVRIRRPNGQIDDIGLSSTVVTAARALRYAPERYFVTEDSVFLPVLSLILSRVRPDGISRAVKLMACTYDGLHPRRKPIDIRYLDDTGHLVIDGNSTVAVATAAGWPTVPCLIAVPGPPVPAEMLKKLITPP